MTSIAAAPERARGGDAGGSSGLRIYSEGCRRRARLPCPRLVAPSLNTAVCDDRRPPVASLGTPRATRRGASSTKSCASTWRPSSPPPVLATTVIRLEIPWESSLDDNDDKFWTRFDEVAAGTAIKILRTPIRAPNANAFCERFLRSVRAEYLDHVHPRRGSPQVRPPALLRLLQRRTAAPRHRSAGSEPAACIPNAEGVVVKIPVLGGLHHEYRRAA